MFYQPVAHKWYKLFRVSSILYISKIDFKNLLTGKTPLAQRVMQVDT